MAQDSKAGMAKLKRMLDKIEELPEALRELYVEKEGKFYLNAEEEDVTGLKSALEKERKAARDAAARLRAYDGIDPEKYAQLTAAAEEAERKRAAAEGDWKKLEEQLVAKHQETVNKEKARGDRLLGALHRRILVAGALEALSAAKCRRPKIVLPHMQGHLKVVEDGDDFAVRVIDAAGQVRISPKGSNAVPMTLEELALEMRDDPEFAPDFDGSAATGSGGGGASARVAGGKITMTESEARDTSVYRARNEAAIKAGQTEGVLIVPG